eukprot:COSAG01_NODE_544_length_15682_cov_107.959379_9_plen_84_part_00
MWQVAPSVHLLRLVIAQPTFTHPQEIPTLLCAHINFWELSMCTLLASNCGTPAPAAAAVAGRIWSNVSTMLSSWKAWQQPEHS